MTSKAQQAKDAQGYTKTGKQCQSCAFFFSIKTEITHPYLPNKKIPIRKDTSCKLGDFPVLLTAYCDKHEPLKQDK